MMLEASTPDGQIVVMGPNFRFCYREYFDCADHTLALTHTMLPEHLYAAGFQVTQIRPQFLSPLALKTSLPSRAHTVVPTGASSLAAPRKAIPHCRVPRQQWVGHDFLSATTLKVQSVRWTVSSGRWARGGSAPGVNHPRSAWWHYSQRSFSNRRLMPLVVR